MEIRIEKTTAPKAKPAADAQMGFGQIFTDHMFIMDYETGKGWYDPRIVPYGPLDLMPSAMCLHYGQTVFEGMKAYRSEEGEILLFRPDENFKRLNVSNQRLCIPPVDEEFCVEAVKKLVELEKDWVPSAPGTSLYIRPFIIATDPVLGVHPANHYYLIIILSPSGAYYASGLAPVRIYVEDNYVRAVRGGTGMAKTGGNYAASLAAQDEAHKSGYSQVLWLDGVERKYVEEVGAMNVFFVFEDEIVTPTTACGSILSGITRKSALQLLQSWGLNACERRISIQEIVDRYEKGEVLEMFGTGTAAVISPVGELKWEDHIMIFNDGKIGGLTQKLYDTMTGIQLRRLPDPFGWSVKVCDA